jgi:hypothetical protein
MGRKWCTLKCPNCGKLFERLENKTIIGKPSNRYTCCSRICRGKLSSKIQSQGITHEVEAAISGNIVSRYRKYLHDNPEGTSETKTP